MGDVLHGKSYLEEKRVGAEADEIKILMVEDEQYVVDQYRSLTGDQTGISIVYDTGSEQRALQYLERHEIDVMILDLELEEGDGISLLEEIQERGMDKPFIVVVTNTVSNVTLSYIRAHGADYVYQKMNALYSPVRVISVIQKIYPYKRFAKPVKEHPLVTDFNRQRAQIVMRHNLESELEMIGIKRKMVGFRFLVEAVMLYVESPEEDVHITNDIYPEVAKLMHTTSMSVERSIRSAIEAAFTKADIVRLHRYYPFPYDDDKGRPTNTQFIANMADRIRITD